MSKEKILVRDYSGIPTRVLNESIRRRERQIEEVTAGKFDSAKTPTKKSLAQLKYELDMMTNALMERSMTKLSEPTETKGDTDGLSD